MIRMKEQSFWVERRLSVRFECSIRSRALAVASAVFLLLLSACGYHTAGHANTLPTNLHTIAIPAFVNHTQTYKIEQRLTAAVVRELITRTHYHILNRPMALPTPLCMAPCSPPTPRP